MIWHRGVTLPPQNRYTRFINQRIQCPPPHSLSVLPVRSSPGLLSALSATTRSPSPITILTVRFFGSVPTAFQLSGHLSSSLLFGVSVTLTAPVSVESNDSEATLRHPPLCCRTCRHRQQGSSIRTPLTPLLIMSFVPCSLLSNRARYWVATKTDGSQHPVPLTATEIAAWGRTSR